jgi:hypothetical protein
VVVTTKLFCVRTTHKNGFLPPHPNHHHNHDHNHDHNNNNHNNNNKNKINLVPVFLLPTQETEERGVVLRLPSRLFLLLEKVDGTGRREEKGETHFM